MIKLYFKQAWQLLKQNPLFSSVYILGTGLGIAMTMSLVIIYYIKMAPVYPEENRNRILVSKGMTVAEQKNQENWFSSHVSFQAVKRFYYPLKSAEAVGTSIDGCGTSLLELPGKEDLKEVQVKLVDAGFWKVFKFAFVDGKPFTQVDFDSGLRKAVISRTMARQLFGEDTPIGRTFVLDSDEYRVCGVVKDVSFITPATYADIWLPLTVDADIVKDNEDSYELIGNLNVYMLAPSVGAKEEVIAEVRDVFRKYNYSQKKYTADLHGQPVSYWKSIFYEYSNSAPDWGQLLRTYGTILLALLFVPALNLAGMIASRMKRQLSELGIRKAFGASKVSLLLQVFWENLFLTCIGGLFGLLLSYLIVYGGRNWLPDLLASSADVMPEGTDNFLTPGMLLNPVVIGITFVVSLVLNVLSALIPALHALRKDIVYSLNEKR
ncbi:ABC transporter permease [Bacteroides fragilis]|uniref:ABC transporter permease n=1 Tax=Bacteroides fragilis TaxID=817 RepID=UPI001C70150B|nr:ABC transporter permease [Bacteroides fragilis]MBW9278186.1 FtsX-like permease family protein [Bacteroides fragilis]